jgi:hypothetical protein
MPTKHADPSQTPWYRQFWPWFIIAIPSMAVIGGFVTLWLALTYPETLVVDDSQYKQIRTELKAQPTQTEETEPGEREDGAS